MQPRIKAAVGQGAQAQVVWVLSRQESLRGWQLRWVLALLIGTILQEIAALFQLKPSW